MATLKKMYTITFSASGIASVTVGLDADPITVPSGYGGWTVISRQRRVGLTTWEGKDPIRMTVPVLFDGLADGTSQEVLISRLSRMALPPTTGGEPPQVRISGTGVPNPGPTHWVIENLQWGSNVVRDFASNGVHARLRQDCVVNLLEYRAEDVAAFKSISPGLVHNNSTTTSKGGKSGWPKNYTVKSGDTLAGIAAHEYGDASKWRKISDANNIRDPNIIKQPSQVGRVLKIPAP